MFISFLYSLLNIVKFFLFLTFLVGVWGFGPADGTKEAINQLFLLRIKLVVFSLLFMYVCRQIQAILKEKYPEIILLRKNLSYYFANKKFRFFVAALLSFFVIWLIVRDVILLVQFNS